MTDPNRPDLGRVFNEVPELYDRVRPGYPDELFADLVTITGADERSSVLEVGCGTGQATRSLAALGCSVTAIEPGAEMAAFARQRMATTGSNVTVETSTFEEWDDRGRRFDLLVAASAWHWVDPSIGWPRAHEVLLPGGWMALLGNVVVRRPGEPEVYAETADLHERYAPGNPGWGHPPLEEDLRATDQGWGLVEDPGGWFGPTIVRWYPTVQWFDGDGFADLLRSTSLYRGLDRHVHEPLLDAIAKRIRTRMGDRASRRYLSVLRVGQRVEQPDRRADLTSGTVVSVVRRAPWQFTGRMNELPIVRAQRIPVTSTYHGVDVTEDYRWLEDASSAETIAWTKAQQHRTRAYFDRIPWRDTLRTRVDQLLKAEMTTYLALLSGDGTFFALKMQAPRQQPFLVALTDLDDLATERIVVDPNAIDPAGETTIDFFVPSPDGKRVAVSLSEHGTEDGSLHIYDVESGKVVDEPIPHVNLMGGSVAWRHDSSAFWYTRCADPAGFRQQVWFREFGGPPDRVDLAGGFADEKIAENFLSTSSDGGWVMDRVQKGDGGEWQVFLRGQGADGEWWQAADVPDKCVHAALGTDALFLLSRRDAPHGKVLRLPLTDGATIADATEIVPAGELAVEDLAVTRDTVWVVDMDGGPQQVRAFDGEGRPLPRVEIPAVSAVSSYSARLAQLGPDRIAWSCESFTDPATWWIAADGEPPRPTALSTTTPVDLSRYDVTREFATSKDGTRIPLNVIAAPGTPRDGTVPAQLTAYGGYSISLVPRFDPEILLWLEQGGVYVVANIRGGGEFGEEWHQQGRLTSKQNCFDDFIACADYLHDSGITSRERLAIKGGSNGGLLMGAVLTQRPDIARAVAAAVPVMDSLRAETTTNGRFNAPEYGTVEDPESFATLLDYSPYHNVVDGTGYPAVLLTAGENDTRVDAWHAKKMTARLQEATSSQRPVLLRLESTGHSAGSLDQAADKTTDWYAFLFDQLGLGYRRVVPT